MTRFISTPPNTPPMDHMTLLWGPEYSGSKPTRLPLIGQCGGQVFRYVFSENILLFWKYLSPEYSGDHPSQP